MLELILLDGSDRRVLLSEGVEVTVGAAAQAAVRLRAADVSRQHALITCRNGKIVLLDLGSTNGTFVNGRQVKEAVLSSGDVVRFSSVMAQVQPAGVEADRTAVATHAASSPPDGNQVTSDRMPVILHESLIWLLSRWAVADGGAVGALVEWLVGHRGMKAASVVEEVRGEVMVVAVHGAVEHALKDARLHALARAPVKAGSTVETIQFEVADEPLMAVRAADLPCLVVMPLRAMPDGVELELYVRLLAVARHLDAPAVRRRPSRDR